MSGRLFIACLQPLSQTELCDLPLLLHVFTKLRAVSFFQPTSEIEEFLPGLGLSRIR